MFACFGGTQFWPITNSVVVFNTDLRTTAKGYRFGIWAETSQHSLPEMLDHSPHPRGPGPRRLFFVGTRDGRTVLLSSSPSERILYSMATRAQALKTDGVAAAFIPGTAHVSPLSYFGTYRYPGRRVKPVFGRDERAVSAIWTEERWHWQEIGQPLPFETPHTYTARRKADRLSFHQIGQYLAAVGIPVDDPTFLTGPVITTTFEGNGTWNRSWTDMTDLRTQLGYDPDNPVTDQLGTAHP